MTDLTKIITPFGYLDGETQAALRSLPKGAVQMLMTDGEWREITRPTFSPGNVYRQQENENPAPGHYSGAGSVWRKTGTRPGEGPREPFIQSRDAPGALRGEYNVTSKEQRVWTYLLNNRQAMPYEVARECNVEEEFVRRLIERIGTPEEVWRAPPGDAAFEAAGGGYPDDNPKSQYGEQKPKISSSPVMPIREMGKVFELGAKKYGRYNWRLHNVSATVYYDAAWRHLTAWFDGEDIDPESKVNHLAHVMACMAILMDAKYHGNLNDNRLDAEDTL